VRASAQNVRPQSRNGRSEWFAVVLGNDVAIKAYRDGEVTFPDGAVIASLHYRFVPSEEKNKAFGQAQSFVPGESHERSVHGQGLKEVHLDRRLGIRSFQSGRHHCGRDPAQDLRALPREGLARFCLYPLLTLTQW